MEILTEQLLRHEGLRLKPYRDTEGKLTIGIGRNLDDTGISRDEAMMMLKNDIVRSADDLKKNLPFFDSVDAVRRSVLLNMTFNMGIHRLLDFRHMLRALQAGDYETAAREMLNSKWAGQVGNRAVELSNLMRNGG